MTVAVESFVHRFIPATKDGPGHVLLLLHGTGGNEDDLLPLAPMLSPAAAVLSPRGKVLENGMPRFFRRLAEGVFDLEDLQLRTHELADWITSARDAYDFTDAPIIAAGFSNGANIAASVLLLRPEVLSGAILLSPMVPFIPGDLPDLREVPVFIGAGRSDPIVPTEQSERLATLLREAGANVELHWDPGGHAISRGEIDAARRWSSSAF